MSGTTADSRILGFVEALGVVLRQAAEVRVGGIDRVALLASAGRVLAAGCQGVKLQEQQEQRCDMCEERK